MAFEYHWLKRTATLEFELVYLFDYAIIVLLSLSGVQTPLHVVFCWGLLSS
jgi:hypothetical protein